MSTRITTPVTWQPIGEHAYMLAHGKRIFEVRRDPVLEASRNGFDWRASWRDAGSKPDDLREFQACASRKQAMDWCWAKVEPDAIPADTMHLIGEAA